MDIHLHFYGDVTDIKHGHDHNKEVLEKLNLIISKQDKMGQELDNLTQEVAEVKTVQASAVVLLKGLKKRLDEAGTDSNWLLFVLPGYSEKRF